MKTMNNTWMKGMAMMAMMVMSMGMMAQNRLVVTEHGIGHAGNDKAGERKEVRHDEGRYNDSRDMRYDDRDARYDDRNMRYDNRDARRNDDRYDSRSVRHDNRDMRYDTRTPGRGHVEVYVEHGHRIPPRYVDRVRYVDGRWGYLRGNRWYYYDTYFEPDYYYSHPVRHFHAYRLGPVGKAVVATAAVVGLVHALVH